MGLKSYIHPIDRQIGQRVRDLRRARGITQSSLAGALGLSFQQVQKYETGANRISGSALVATAKALDIPIERLFEGIADPVDRPPVGSDPTQDHKPMTIQPHSELLADLERLPDPLRQRLISLVRRLAQKADDARAGPPEPRDPRRRRPRSASG